MVRFGLMSSEGGREEGVGLTWDRFKEVMHKSGGMEAKAKPGTLTTAPGVVELLEDRLNKAKRAGTSLDVKVDRPPMLEVTGDGAGGGMHALSGGEVERRRPLRLPRGVLYEDAIARQQELDEKWETVDGESGGEERKVGGESIGGSGEGGGGDGGGEAVLHVAKTGRRRESEGGGGGGVGGVGRERVRPLRQYMRSKARKTATERAVGKFAAAEDEDDAPEDMDAIIARLEAEQELEEAEEALEKSVLEGKLGKHMAGLRGPKGEELSAKQVEALYSDDVVPILYSWDQFWWMLWSTSTGRVWPEVDKEAEGEGGQVLIDDASEGCMVLVGKRSVHGWWWDFCCACGVEQSDFRHITLGAASYLRALKVLSIILFLITIFSFPTFALYSSTEYQQSPDYTLRSPPPSTSTFTLTATNVTLLIGDDGEDPDKIWSATRDLQLLQTPKGLGAYVQWQRSFARASLAYLPNPTDASNLRRVLPRSIAPAEDASAIATAAIDASTGGGESVEEDSGENDAEFETVSTADLGLTLSLLDVVLAVIVCAIGVFLMRGLTPESDHDRKELPSDRVPLPQARSFAKRPPKSMSAWRRRDRNAMEPGRLQRRHIEPWEYTVLLRDIPSDVFGDEVRAFAEGVTACPVHRVTMIDEDELSRVSADWTSLSSSGWTSHDLPPPTSSLLPYLVHRLDLAMELLWIRWRLAFLEAARVGHVYFDLSFRSRAEGQRDTDLPLAEQGIERDIRNIEHVLRRRRRIIQSPKLHKRKHFEDADERPQDRDNDSHYWVDADKGPMDKRWGREVEEEEDEEEDVFGVGRRGEDGGEGMEFRSVIDRLNERRLQSGECPPTAGSRTVLRERHRRPRAALVTFDHPAGSIRMQAVLGDGCCQRCWRPRNAIDLHGVTPVSTTAPSPSGILWTNALPPAGATVTLCKRQLLATIAWCRGEGEEYDEESDEEDEDESDEEDEDEDEESEEESDESGEEEEEEEEEKSEEEGSSVSRKVEKSTGVSKKGKRDEEKKDKKKKKKKRARRTFSVAGLIDGAIQLAWGVIVVGVAIGALIPTAIVAFIAFSNRYENFDRFTGESTTQDVHCAFYSSSSLPDACASWEVVSRAEVVWPWVAAVANVVVFGPVLGHVWMRIGHVWVREEGLSSFAIWSGIFQVLNTVVLPTLAGWSAYDDARGLHEDQTEAGQAERAYYPLVAWLGPGMYRDLNRTWVIRVGSAIVCATILTVCMHHILFGVFALPLWRFVGRVHGGCMRLLDRVLDVCLTGCCRRSLSMFVCGTAVQQTIDYLSFFCENRGQGLSVGHMTHTSTHPPSHFSPLQLSQSPIFASAAPHTMAHAYFLTIITLLLSTTLPLLPTIAFISIFLHFWNAKAHAIIDAARITAEHIFLIEQAKTASPPSAHEERTLLLPRRQVKTWPETPSPYTLLPNIPHRSPEFGRWRHGFAKDIVGEPLPPGQRLPMFPDALLSTAASTAPTTLPASYRLAHCMGCTFARSWIRATLIGMRCITPPKRRRLAGVRLATVTMSDVSPWTWCGCGCQGFAAEEGGEGEELVARRTNGTIEAPSWTSNIRIPFRRLALLFPRNIAARLASFHPRAFLETIPYLLIATVTLRLILDLWILSSPRNISSSALLPRPWLPPSTPDPLTDPPSWEAAQAAREKGEPLTIEPASPSSPAIGFLAVHLRLWQQHTAPILLALTFFILISLYVAYTSSWHQISVMRREYARIVPTKSGGHVSVPDASQLFPPIQRIDPADPAQLTKQHLRYSVAERYGLVRGVATYDMTEHPDLRTDEYFFDTRPGFVARRARSPRHQWFPRASDLTVGTSDQEMLTALRRAGLAPSSTKKQKGISPSTTSSATAPTIPPRKPNRRDRRRSSIMGKEGIGVV